MTITEQLLALCIELGALAAVFAIGCWWGDELDRRENRWPK